MKVNQRLAISLVVLLAAVGAFWLLLLSPRLDKVNQLSAQTRQLQSDIAQQHQQITYAKQARSHFPSDYQQLVVLGKAVPSDDDSASLLAQVNGVSQQAGVQFRSLELSQSGQSGPASSPSPSGPGAPTATQPVPQGGSGSGSSGSGSSAQPASASSGGSSASTSSSSPSSSQGPSSTPASNSSSSGSSAGGSSSAGSSGSSGASSSGTSASSTPASAPSSASASEATAAALPIGATIGSADLPILPYKLQFRGSFFHVADFIQGIDSLVSSPGQHVAVDGRLLTVNGFSLSEDPKTRFPNLLANFVVTSYVTPQSQGLTGGATPQGPALPSSQPQATPASNTGGTP